MIGVLDVWLQNNDQTLYEVGKFLAGSSAQALVLFGRVDADQPNSFPARSDLDDDRVAVVYLDHKTFDTVWRLPSSFDRRGGADPLEASVVEAAWSEAATPQPASSDRKATINRYSRFVLAGWTIGRSPTR